MAQDVNNLSPEALDELEAEAYEREKKRMRSPPSARAAEREVVADVLTYGHEVMQSLEEVGLHSDHFEVEELGVVFSVALSLFRQQEAVTIAAVTDALLADGKLEDIGGPLGIERMASFHTPSHSVVSLLFRITAAARIVVEKARLRAGIEIAREMASRCYLGAERADEIFEAAHQALTEAQSTDMRGGNVDLVRAVRDEMRTMPALGGRRASVPTGLIDVDRAMGGGLSPGGLYVIAARPGMGKTEMMLSICSHLTMSRGLWVQVFSMEMPAGQLIARAAGALSGVSPSNAKASPSEAARLADACARVSESRLLIDETTGLTISQLSARAHATHRSTPLSLVAVDYLQLMQGESRGRGEQSENHDLQIISRGLKILARQLKVPVLALAQLNRDADRRANNKRPVMSDIRGSGAVEQDADLIAFLYREEFYGGEATPADLVDVAEFIVGKNRHGPSHRTVKLWFSGTPRTFKSMDRTR